VKGIGKRKKGKPQLHADEAARFLDKAHELADQGQMAGFVAAGAFYFGTRITELVSRPVRDLDLDGWWLWISDSKTESGRRKLDVPAEFRPYLLKLAEGKGAHESLFIGERKGKTVTRYTAYDMVKRVCRLAGVPVVTPHGLRGTHASIAREAGATPNIVAAAIGHRSYAVTQRHYLAAGSEERAQQQTVMKVIRGGKRGN
jgi:integrase